MAIGAARVRVSILAAGLLFVLGCEKKDHGSHPTEVGANIVCPQLCQESDSLADALAFIEVPEDRLASSLASVSKRGELANPRQLAFANKLFSLRKSKDVELFKSLLSDDTRKQLDEPDDNKHMVHRYLKEIENGAFLYGQWDFRFFATFRSLTQDDLDMLGKNVSFAQTPTHIIIVYHFHRPNYMLIGDSCYLVEDGNSYRIVTETLLKDELPRVSKKEEPQGPKAYGIVSFKRDDDAYSRNLAWLYEWAVELTLDDSENNTFEIIKLTDVIAGEDPNLRPEIAKHVIVEQAVFAKYRYKELKFKFRIGNEAPGGNYSKYGQTLSGWDYTFSIASIGLANSMLFPGTNVTNVQAKERGGFIGSDLEFLSFETAKGNVLYRHRVVLRKTPVSSNAGAVKGSD
jgi:hypothetical protein